MDWSPQCHIVTSFAIVHIINAIREARHLNIFEDKSTAWRTCIPFIFAQVILLGNHTNKVSNSSMLKFCISKYFKVNIDPAKSKILSEVLWNPPPLDWWKCNSNGIASGVHPLYACEGMLKNVKIEHIGSFVHCIGNGNVLLVELTWAMLAIELA